MGSCLSEGIVSREVPLEFRMLFRGCPCLGYAWAYLLGLSLHTCRSQLPEHTGHQLCMCCLASGYCLCVYGVQSHPRAHKGLATEACVVRLHGNPCSVCVA